MSGCINGITETEVQNSSQLRLVKSSEDDFTIISGYENNSIVWKIKKVYKNKNITNLLDTNETFTITRGGTRAVYLLDEIVIKEGDPTCSINCELSTNYFSYYNDVNVSEIIGIIYKNGNPLLCEKNINQLIGSMFLNIEL